MPRQRAILSSLAVLTCALLASGCGNEQRSRNLATAAPAGAVLPGLARAPARRGEIVVHGESSPRTHGPFVLDGRYLIRFEQIAPEDPQLDFSSQTPFTATLRRRAGDPRGAVELFSEGARTGRHELTIHGRYLLDVSFGDFPYAVRFTRRA